LAGAAVVLVGVELGVVVGLEVGVAEDAEPSESPGVAPGDGASELSGLGSSDSVAVELVAVGSVDCGAGADWVCSAVAEPVAVELGSDGLIREEIKDRATKATITMVIVLDLDVLRLGTRTPPTVFANYETRADCII
jgi:hypothetical protein